MTKDAFSALANTFAFGPGFKLGTKDIDKFFVGFDDSFNKMAKLHDEVTKNIPNYPPYNIKKTSDNSYEIELAVAGFAKQNIKLDLEDDKLIVTGLTDGIENEPKEDALYLWKGIANRAFTRTFVLNDQVEVKNAELLNGMLKVFLERIIPEHKKPKSIPINEKTPTTKEFLAEDK